MRELKALELAARAKISRADDGTWTVPSQSTGGTYRVVVWPGAESCTCDDFQLRQEPCKHVIAARLVEEREGRKQAPAIDTDTPPAKKTYTQNWPAYNLAQTTEKHRLQELLKAHVSCGVKTNVVTAVRILDKDAADSPQLGPLVKETARTFTIKEVSGDKAYASVDNFGRSRSAAGPGSSRSRRTPPAGPADSSRRRSTTSRSSGKSTWTTTTSGRTSRACSVQSRQNLATRFGPRPTPR